MYWYTFAMSAGESFSPNSIETSTAAAQAPPSGAGHWCSLHTAGAPTTAPGATYVYFSAGVNTLLLYSVFQTLKSLKTLLTFTCLHTLVAEAAYTFSPSSQKLQTFTWLVMRSGEIWSSVSCPRTHQRVDSRNRTTNFPIGEGPFYVFSHKLCSSN